MRSLVSKFIDWWMEFIEIYQDDQGHISDSLKRDLKILDGLNFVLGWVCSYGYFLIIMGIIKKFFGVQYTGFIILAPLSLASIGCTKCISNKYKFDSCTLSVFLPIVLLMLPITIKRIKERNVMEIIKEVMES